MASSGNAKQGRPGQPREDQDEPPLEPEPGASSAVTVQVEENKEEAAEESEDEHDMIAFEENIWSAVLLMTCTLPNGKSAIPAFDKLAIIASALGAASIQILLVVVVSVAMLQNPYNEDQIGSMLKWRAEQGQYFWYADEKSGLTLMSKICSSSHWSFESDQLETINSYLQGPEGLPGYALGFLALLLWVLAIWKEYHAVTEYARAIYTLPAKTDSHSAMLEDGAITVVSISGMSRTLLMLFVCLPRLVIASLLLLVGGRYISETPGLSDLVLNAIALEFVLDVDEVLFTVICSRKVQGLVQSATPLSIGKRPVMGGIPVLDLLRYILLAAAYSTLAVVYLLPFTDSVKTAQTALCGGNLNFTWSQDLLIDPVVVYDDTSATIPDCSQEDTQNVYMNKYYPITNPVLLENSAGDKNKMRAVTGSTNDVSAMVALNYAFKDVSVPSLDGLLKTFKAESGKGLSGKSIPSCNRFNASQGWQSCVEMRRLTNASACYWPFESFQCEGKPQTGGLGKNKVYALSCWDEVAEPDKKVERYEQCLFWMRAGVPHPYDPDNVCDGGYDAAYWDSWWEENQANEVQDWEWDDWEWDDESNDDQSRLRRLSQHKATNRTSRSKIPAATTTSTPRLVVRSEEAGEVALMRSELVALRQEVSQLRSESAELRGLLAEVRSLRDEWQTLRPEAILS
eukprot:CAMPEP_0197624878 /NCGR_PEP_ID=MMETSP1338-20131121/4388_1 /TAXON_ID=43686 ORGANISM="Pelagodinium beii, Strain RCC1491" /NCGR_SAMPLE_ID=MMETSP1338 /ASSEMBLY_ACC=CAM_ASM_000754 /LENGTH=683 /DNA_ID=CAMNT_0043195129 /DNA_START=39 /DNA_END=2090 /DNA_ORIENTATION=-